MSDNEALFETWVNNVIDEEVGGRPNGGYTNDPRDPGGETKWGIAKRAHPSVDIANLTRPAAVAIYRAEYWEPLLPFALSPKLLPLAAECAVNQGLSYCKHLLETTKAPDEFMARRTLDYIKNPRFDTYGHGWIRRLFVECLR